MRMQIETTGSMIEACLIISEKDHRELLKAFGARLEVLMKNAKCVCKNQARMTFDEANQEYWTSNKRRNALHPDLIKVLDDLTKCQRARESLLRVVKPKADGRAEA